MDRSAETADARGALRGSQRVVRSLGFGLMFAVSIKLLSVLPLPGAIALVLVVPAISDVFNRSTR